MEWKERLLEGNKRYVDGKREMYDLEKRRKEVAESQKPFVVVLTCADSRVVPEYIFDANIGEIFTIRVAGNIADNIVLGSMEYAVQHLGVEAIVVLGHTNCGAVAAACKGNAEGNMEEIVKKIKRNIGEEKDVYQAIKKNILGVVCSIQEQSRTIFLRKKKIALTGMLYDLESGKVEILE